MIFQEIFQHRWYYYFRSKLNSVNICWKRWEEGKMKNQLEQHIMIIILLILNYTSKSCNLSLLLAPNFCLEQNTRKRSCLFSIFVKYLQAEGDCETLLCASFLQMDLRQNSQIQRKWRCCWGSWWSSWSVADSSGCRLQKSDPDSERCHMTAFNL